MLQRSRRRLWATGLQRINELAPRDCFRRGQRATTGETPLWFFTGEVGDFVTIDLAGASPSYDPDLNLRNSSGAVIFSNNDSGEGYNGYNARILDFFIQENGTYFIQAGQPDSLEQYTLNLSRIQPASIVADQERFATTAQQSIWTFEGRAGDILNLAMVTNEDTFDLFMTLLGPNGQYLTESYGGGGDFGVLISDYLIREDGDYYIRANLADSNTPYTLRMTRTEPEPLIADRPEHSTTIDNSMWEFTGNAGDVVTIELRRRLLYPAPMTFMLLTPSFLYLMPVVWSL